MPISESRPNVSMSMGCHEDQVETRREMYKKAGIKCVDVRPDGVLEFTSNKSRNEVMKLHGYLDKQAGYGQHAGD